MLSSLITAGVFSVSQLLSGYLSSSGFCKTEVLVRAGETVVDAAYRISSGRSLADTIFELEERNPREFGMQCTAEPFHFPTTLHYGRECNV